jgi:hypothetical protein
VERTVFDWKPERAGIPQGAVLAPLLYNTYVVVIPRIPGIEISQFADDTAAYTSNKNINYAVNNLQMYVYHLESRLHKWKMKINTGDSSAVIFTKMRQVPRNRLNLFAQEIPRSAGAKYSGIHLERRLTWKAHIKAKGIKQCKAL